MVSTHFMESPAERAWIDEGNGDFQSFFSAFNPHAKPMCTSVEYLSLFEKNATLFTHGVHANQAELQAIAEQNATLTHCPVSNRLLGVGKLDLEAVENEKINLTLGTDGLSSNISLSLWDELRCALMMHPHKELNALAKTLLQSVTCNAAHALKLPCGALKEGLASDMIVVTLPQECVLDALPLQLILHTHHTHLTFIDGEEL